MSHLKILKGSACAVALATASPAFADVTAQDVWDNWKESMSVYGEDSLSIGSETMDGDTLTVEGIQFDFSDDNVQAVLELGTLTFTEQGDGTVAVGVEESYPMTFTDENDVEFAMRVEQTGMDILASGDPEAMNYRIRADQYGVVVEQFENPEDGSTVDLRVMGNDLDLTYDVSDGELTDTQNVVYGGVMGSIDLLADVTVPADDMAFLVSGKIESVSVQADMVMPTGAAMENPEAIFQNGFSIDGSYQYDSANYLLEANEAGQTTQGAVSTGAGSLTAKFNETIADYAAKATDVIVDVTAAQMPFPVKVSFAEYDFRFQMPLAATEEPEAFGLKLNLADLNVNDEIWMMGDPAGALPHDPITARFDVTGTMKLFFDLLDPEQAEAMEQAAIPAELYSVDLNDLLLKAAGAEVTGSGSFTFDNEDLQTFNGMPRPEGEVTLNINGANQLIDSLVDMGLLPADQATMGRMMMGMFARTVGEDQLTSTIEVNDQGHVLANGQRLQ